MYDSFEERNKNKIEKNILLIYAEVMIPVFISLRNIFHVVGASRVMKVCEAPICFETFTKRLDSGITTSNSWNPL